MNRFQCHISSINNMLVTGILPYTAVLLSAVKSSYFHVLHGYHCAVKAGQEGCVRNSSILAALYSHCVGRKTTTPESRVY